MGQDTIKTGLLFGSFNPIHLGHLMIAGYMVEFTDIREVWFVVSPHNPLKEQATLLPDVNRLYMVNVAVEDEPRFRASNIEFHLPRPSFTIDTLTCLKERHPSHKFVIMAGADILPTLSLWKESEQLIDRYRFYIYPRWCGDDESSGAATGVSGPMPFHSHPSMTFVDAPLIGISSSFIRRGIREGKDMHFFLPAKVWEYIDGMGFYR